MTAYRIVFEPLGLKGQCSGKESLSDCARRIGVSISNVCGGHGTCHTCRVKVTKGVLSAPTTTETEIFSAREIKEGWRLACQAVPRSDCQLFLPTESMSASQRVVVEGLEIGVPPEPPVKAYRLKMKAPSLTDQRADADRLLKALDAQHHLSCNKIDTDILRSISTQMRLWNWKCQASVRDDEVVALGSSRTKQLGLAVDLGTTTIAGYLLDLDNGRTLTSQGVLNPQISYGEDVISRINYAVKSPSDGLHLQKLVVDKLNELASTLCSTVSVDTDSIVEAVVVGNTAMHHLLLGLAVRQLALAPFIPVTGQALDVKAHELGIHLAPGAYIHFPPLVTGFIGSDHLAMLLAMNATKTKGPVITLDIGTNTEISLVNGNEITSTSCASGPAFEGGHIKHGMRAGKGAIERLQITKDAINYQTIDEAPPVAICGSGILDAVAQLYLAGIIDDGGRLASNHPRVNVRHKQAEFLLVNKEKQDGHPEIVITQKDIREIQLAKAAIRTGIKLLLEVNGLEEEQIKQIIIAGAFGSYIDISSAITVGLVPPLPINHFKQVGNAAGIGAKMALISLSKRKEALDIASRIHYIELAGNLNFNKTFIETTHIGRYWMKNGKREVLEHGKEVE